MIILNIGTSLLITLLFNLTNQFHYSVLCQGTYRRVANRLDPDQTANEPSDLGLHCLQRQYCPDIHGIVV